MRGGPCEQTLREGVWLSLGEQQERGQIRGSQGCHAKELGHCPGVMSHWQALTREMTLSYLVSGT